MPVAVVASYLVLLAMLMVTNTVRGRRGNTSPQVARLDATFPVRWGALTRPFLGHAFLAGFLAGDILALHYRMGIYQKRRCACRGSTHTCVGNTLCMHAFQREPLREDGKQGSETKSREGMRETRMV